MGKIYLALVSIMLIGNLGRAQTTLIDPSGNGGFNNGSTFAANGWTVANQGTNPSKWVVGSAVSATNPGAGPTGTATTSSGSYTVTLTANANNSKIVVGQPVTGAGIPSGTYVNSVASATSITVTQPVLLLRLALR